MKTDPQQFERDLQSKFPELAATENDPIIAQSAEAFTRDQAKIKVLAKMLNEWMEYFENDFENDEDSLNYLRMQAYIESADYMTSHFPGYTDHLYRERMYRRVKERMSEIKI